MLCGCALCLGHKMFPQEVFSKCVLVPVLVPIAWHVFYAEHIFDLYFIPKFIRCLDNLCSYIYIHFISLQKCFYSLKKPLSPP